MLRKTYRATGLMAVSLIGVIGACGDPASRQAESSQGGETAAATAPISVESTPSQVMSDGSVCTPLPISDAGGGDQAVGASSCVCAYDLFSDYAPPSCYPRNIRSWLHPSAGSVGSKLDEIPVESLGFKPTLPPGLEIQAVSTSDFGVSGTYPGLGRLIIAEVANDPLLGGGLQEQIDATSKLSGSVENRLTDGNPDNDATVVSAAATQAMVRFPQDAQTTKGQPQIEQVEWLAGDVRYSVVIQLGQDAVLHSPTYDDSIANFIDSFVPIS